MKIKSSQIYILYIIILIILWFISALFIYLRRDPWISEGVLRKGQFYLFTASISPDKQYQVKIGMNGVPRVWKVSSGKVITVFKGHHGWVNSAEFSPDGTLVVSTGADQKSRIWDAFTGKEVLTLEESSYVYSANFAPSGNFILTGNENNEAKIWSFPEGKVLKIFKGHHDGVLMASYSPDGCLILTASWDGTAQIWDVETGNSLAVFVPKTGTFDSARFTPDGKRVVLSFKDQIAWVWVRQHVEGFRGLCTRLEIWLLLIISVVLWISSKKERFSSIINLFSLIGKKIF